MLWLLQWLYCYIQPTIVNFEFYYLGYIRGDITFDARQMGRWTCWTECLLRCSSISICLALLFTLFPFTLNLSVCVCQTNIADGKHQGRFTFDATHTAAITYIDTDTHTYSDTTTYSTSDALSTTHTTSDTDIDSFMHHSGQHFRFQFAVYFF